MPGASAPSAAQAAAIAAQHNFVIEAFTLLAVGILVVMLRTYARVQAVGLQKLQPDDYLVWFATICYAAETGIAYILGSEVHGLGNSNMTPEQRAALDPNSHEYDLRTLGSKVPLAAWATYGTTLWALKGALLVFYTRLTARLGRGYEVRIYVGFGLVTVSYVVVIMNLFLSCRPFHRFWQINPDPGNVCQAALSRQIISVLFTFNVLTDLYLLSIPLPMLWKAKLRPLKKFGLMFLLSGGILVIICATLRCVLVLKDPVAGGQEAGSWAVRESFAAVVTTNLPAIFPLINRWLMPFVETLLTSIRSSHKPGDTPKNITLVTFGGSGGGGGMPNNGHRWKQPGSNPIRNSIFSESEERMVEEVRMQDFGEDKGPDSTHHSEPRPVYTRPPGQNGE